MKSQSEDQGVYHDRHQVSSSTPIDQPAAYLDLNNLKAKSVFPINNEQESAKLDAESDRIGLDWIGIEIGKQDKVWFWVFFFSLRAQKRREKYKRGVRGAVERLKTLCRVRFFFLFFRYVGGCVITLLSTSRPWVMSCVRFCCLDSPMWALCYCPKGAFYLRFRATFPSQRTYV